jgi:SAM-dependent methyltransferase
MELERKACNFCSSEAITLVYPKQFHSKMKQWGPFDIYSCIKCNSLSTLPLPTAAAINSFYCSLDFGIEAATAAIRKESPLTSWYLQCIHTAMKASLRIEKGRPLRWLDIAAGSGELSRLMLELYPDSIGIAVDLHDRPADLVSFNNLQWIKADLNGVDISCLIGGKFDFIFGISILEHILSPKKMVDELLNLVRKDSVVYFATPASTSLAAKILKKKWPYFLPGEHLNIPSLKGMQLMLERCLASSRPTVSGLVVVRSIRLLYPLRYVFNYFQMPLLGSVFNNKISVKIPSGALEGIVIIL